MKKKTTILISIVVLVLIILSACTKTPTENPVAETSTAEKPTEFIPAVVAPSPTPEPTEEPILPCNITFDSDRDGNREIYSMDPEGANQVNLTNHPADDYDPVWSPDGAQIAFVSNRESEEGSGVNIYKMNADGSEVTLVSSNGDGQFPDWSPLGDKIAYNSGDDLYLANLTDGSVVNVTNSPERDSQPKFSPDGQRIAWLIGEDSNQQIFVMNLDGSNPRQITNGGHAVGADWTIDGRIFTVWENQPEGICFNCVVTADGSEVIEAGGKGTIQEFLPFWTSAGERVEMASLDISGSGHDDIALIGEIFPDYFKFLTNDAGNNRDPDTPARCGPYYGANPAASEANSPSSNELIESAEKMVIGYTGSIDPMMQDDFNKACSELDVECVHAESVADLAAQGVDAIINASNRWDINGSAPQVHDAVSSGIPVFVLNAENSEQGVYNLSAENGIITTILAWMFKSNNDQGKFLFYNFGNNDYIQSIVDSIVKGYPEISVEKIEASYDQNPFINGEIQSKIAANPDLRGIWSSEPSNDLFWAVVDTANAHKPLIECPAREDMLIAWKNELDSGSDFQCFAFIRPGGTAYEGVYAAYYLLSGYEFNPENLTGESHNTLRYSIPEITNETLPEWLGKLDGFIVGSDSQLKLPAMEPNQILETWFMQ